MVTKQPLTVIPVSAPVRKSPFDLHATIIDSMTAAGQSLQDGDVLAISSKYTSISEGRIVRLHDVRVGPQAAYIANRYVMNPQMVQLILEEADYVFGGITHEFDGMRVGFLLTYTQGIVSPNAGIDRSNIPEGLVVLFPTDPYQKAAEIRREIHDQLGVTVGIILTDSWLMPGRIGTTGVALATAGFRPVQDERGKIDLFGNPMRVTRRGIADAICSCAQMVMGETDEATPFAIVRNTGVAMVDEPFSVADVAIPWDLCIYIGSLTEGSLEDLTAVVQMRKSGVSLP